MKQYSCIIFDLDGTLTRTNELIYATFNHVTQKYLGKTFTPVEITGFFGPPEELVLEKLVGKDRAPDAIADFLSYYREHFAQMAKAYHGMSEILEYLVKSNVKVAVFTGKGRRSTLITLDAIGFTHFFDCIVTGSDVIRPKPAGEGIQHILDAFKLDPTKTVMVGDAVSDIRAAKETGVVMAAVVWDSYGKDTILSMNVDNVFHTVEDFNKWIKEVIPQNGESLH